MTLEPQDDNRDGVALRVATQHLLQRSESQKFLIVFLMGNLQLLIMQKTAL